MDSRRQQTRWFNATSNIIKKHRLTLLVLSAAVVFVATYLLILPAMTLDEDEAARQGGIDLPLQQELSYEGNGYAVSADCDAKAGLPEGTELAVSELDQGAEDYQALYDEALQAVQVAEGGEEVSDFGFARFYDISLLSEDGPMEPEAPVDVTISYDKAIKADDADHLRIVHFGENGPEVLAPDQVSYDMARGKLKAAAFAAESFSVYAVVYTVDFAYEVDGETFEYSMEGGGSIGLRTLLPLLGVVDESGADAFTERIADVRFSDDTLIEVTKKDGDWILNSLQPFDTEEELTIIMEDGQEFVVKVTDAQAVTDSAAFKTSERFIIAYVDAQGKYNVLTADGSRETFDSPGDIDFLDSKYMWRFYYVFTEKDQDAPNANFEYYFIRPVEDLTKSIALIDVNDEELIQNGTNNIAVIPQGDGTFVMEGYSSAGDPMPLLYYNGTGFVTDMDRSSPLTIFTQDDIKKYQFTVRTADPTMGLVSGKDKDGVQRDNVQQFVTRTKDSYNNNWGAQARAKEEWKGGQNRYLFDYFDLNGTRVPADMVEVTDGGRNGKIKQGTLQIPYNGSILTAHFKQNPAYVGASKVESLKEWVDEIKSENVPLDEKATRKTAEVYDYENRIYRVDLTTKSSLSSFTGTVDLGLILDVSGSMKFPSKLVAAKNAQGGEIGTRNIRQINDVTEWGWWGGPARYAWQDWGLDIGTEYYVIAEKSTRATVFRIFYEGGSWYRVDSSFDNQAEDDKGNRRAESISSSTKFGADTDFNYPIYVSGDNDSSGKAVERSFHQKQSIDNTVSTLNEVLGILNIAADSSDAPKVRAAWNTFSWQVKDTSPDHKFVELNDHNSLSIDYETEGGTRTDKALSDALNFTWGDSNTKYAILITDGAPQFGGKLDTDSYNTGSHTLDEKTTELINRIKAIKKTYEENGITLITVGLSMKDVERGNQLLFDIADTIDGEHMFFEAESGDELENVLLEIVKKILQPCTVYGDVTDTVNDAFYPVDRQTGRPLQSGDHISLSGDLTNDLTKPYGTVQPDGKTIKWEGQAFQPEGWDGTIYVKAKEDFLGGNAVATNTGNAVFEAKEYSTKNNPGHKVTITTDLDQVVNKDKFHPVQNRQTPLVNVNELSFGHNETEWTVYLGAEVDPKEQIKELWRKIDVEEVVKKGCAVDLDGDQLPDTGKVQTGNNWYPLTESIGDDREGEASGDRQTYPMNSLLRKLAAGQNYSWWDYTKNEPKWDEFMSQAMTGSGIRIPYHVYGIDDNSNIVITLKKEIAAGEEADLIGKSPHDTAVTGDEVEKYTLKVVYSPDYTVLPRGQGGSNTADFHTGTFGTMYQGHAAGTETSENIHVINVFAKKLQINKVDQTRNAITDSTAEFDLMRRATAEEIANGQIAKVDLEGVGKCVVVQHLTTANGTLTTDALALLKDKEDYDEPYYLKETKAPDGYELLPDVLRVSIDLTGHNTWKKKSDNAQSQTKPDPYELSDWKQEATIKVTGLDGQDTGMAVRVLPDGAHSIAYDSVNDTSAASVTYQILNKAGVELPSSGGPGTTWIYLLGSILILCCGITLIARRRAS